MSPEALTTATHSSRVAWRTTAGSLLAAFSQSASSWAFALAEVVGCAWMLCLQDATACWRRFGVIVAAGPVALEVLVAGVELVRPARLLVAGVEAVRPAVLLLVAVEVVRVPDVELLLPPLQPTRSAPPASATTSHVDRDSLRIIDPRSYSQSTYRLSCSGARRSNPLANFNGAVAGGVLQDMEHPHTQRQLGGQRIPDRPSPAERADGRAAHAGGGGNGGPAERPAARSGPPIADRAANLNGYREHVLQRGVSPVLYWTVRAILVPFFLVYFRMRRIGTEHLPRRGPLLLASNHRSFLDPFVIGTLVRRPVYYMAKRELFDHRLVAWLLSGLGAFPVDRGAGDREAMATARALLARGDCVVIFPEGTRTRPGPLGEPRRGIGRLAVETGAPVAPVAMIGTEDVRRGWRVRPRRVRLRVGRPLLFGAVEEPNTALARSATERIWACVCLQWEWLGGAQAPRLERQRPRATPARRRRAHQPSSPGEKVRAA
jgi:1-acyl-sn-glycerol-3-phosphate acyltransferase